MADVITPDTFSGAFEMPATIGGGRMPRFTKEDLVRALLQTQAQPKSPYSLQFEAPVIVGGAPDREQQFQQDWDAAMQAYQQGLANPRTSFVNPQTGKGFTYEGKTGIEHTPQELFSQYLEPLRFQAAEFSPDISRAFTAEEQARHWANLAKQAVAREKRMDEYAQERKAREARLQAEMDLRKSKEKFPSKSDVDRLFEAKENPAAWDKMDRIYGPGTAQMVMGGRYKDPRPAAPAIGGLGAEMPKIPSFFNPLNFGSAETPPAPGLIPPTTSLPSSFNLSMPSPEVFSATPQAVATLPGPPKLNEANMVLMVDKEGKQWQVPADSVPKAEKTYGWKRQ